VSSEPSKPYWRRPMVIVIVVLILVFVVIPFILSNTLRG
jgi:hypothetical protein